jgi:hypothetical protein
MRVQDAQNIAGGDTIRRSLRQVNKGKRGEKCVSFELEMLLQEPRHASGFCIESVSGFACDVIFDYLPSISNHIKSSERETTK